jgi:hypothetical protein
MAIGLLFLWKLSTRFPRKGHLRDISIEEMFETEPDLCSSTPAVRSCTCTPLLARFWQPSSARAAFDGLGGRQQAVGRLLHHEKQKNTVKIRLSGPFIWSYLCPCSSKNFLSPFIFLYLLLPSTISSPCWEGSVDYPSSRFGCPSYPSHLKLAIKLRQVCFGKL